MMKKLEIAAFCVAVLVVTAGLMGCKKTPGFVGTFNPTMSADQKQKLQEAAKQMAAMAPKGSTQKFDVDAEMKKFEAEMEKVALTIKADGTFTMSGIGKDEMKGTWKAEDTKVTLTPDKEKDSKNPNVGKPITVTYDEKAQTLTGNEGGVAMTFKKKS